MPTPNTSTYDPFSELYSLWAKDKLDRDYDIAGAYGIKCSEVLAKPLRTAADHSMAMICADPNLSRQARIIQRQINLRQKQYADFSGNMGDDQAQHALNVMKTKHGSFLKRLAECDGNRNCILDLQRYRLCELGMCTENTDINIIQSLSAGDRSPPNKSNIHITVIFPNVQSQSPKTPEAPAHSGAEMPDWSTIKDNQSHPIDTRDDNPKGLSEPMPGAE